MKPFDFVNSINVSKDNLIEKDPNCEKDYVPFLTNRALSYFPDTVLYANVMNGFPFLAKKLQYEYLLNSIRPKRRFSKWAKRDESENIKALSRYYGYSMKKAEEVLPIFSQEQIDTIKEKITLGVTNESDRSDGRSHT